MFNWSKYQNVAVNYRNFEDEAFLRSAISRSYYASYCLCRNKIIEQNLATGKEINKILSKSGNIHQLVFEVLNKGNFVNDNDLSKNISDLLHESRIKRNKADYDDVYKCNLKEDVELVLQNTDKILKNIDYLYKKF